MKAAHAWVSGNHVPLSVYESEFWMNMEKPTTLVPISGNHLIQMGEALMEHKGEIARNPYHLTLPAYAMEQMRRGSEAIAGMGSKPRDFIFAQIYRHSRLK